MKSFVKLFLSVLCLTGVLHLHGQEYALSQYSVSDGLSSSTIYKLYQSKSGFLWIATSVGVDRFDGKTFVNYSMEEGLPDTEVIDIAEDHKGRVWFISPNGKISYYYKGQIYIPEFYNTLFKNSSISSFLQHSDGDYYISTRDSGIYRFRNDTFYKRYTNLYRNLLLRLFEDSAGSIWGETYYGFIQLKDNEIINLPLKEGSFSSRVRAIPWNDNNIFFVSSRGLGIHNGVSEFFLEQDYIKLGETDVLSFLPIERTDLWVGTINGAYRFNDLKLKSKPDVLLKNHSVSSMVYDHEGNIWFGTLGDGLFFLPGISFRSYTINSGLLDENIRKITGDAENNIYAGDAKGNLYKIIPGNISKFPTLRGYNQGVYDICPVKEDYVIYSTLRDVYLYEEGSHRKLPHYNGIKCIEMADDSFYICHNHGGYYKISHDQFLNDRRYYTHQKEVVGLHSICTQGNKVFMANSNHVFELIDNTLSIVDIPGLANHGRISDISFSSDSALWIATTGKGLVRFKNNRPLFITRQQGLPSNMCNNITTSNKYVWLATNKGIASIDYESLEVVHVLTHDYGLISNEVNEVYEDKTGTVWAATNQGISYINLGPGPGPGLSVSPPIIITSVTINDSIVTVADEYQLNHDQNRISISFLGVGFKSRGISTFRYKLEGYDTTWYNTGNNGIQYTALPPGEYVFKLEAVSNDNVASLEPATIIFHIRKAFWQTTWFLLLATVLLLSILIGLILLIVKQVKKRQERKYELKKKINALEIQALRSQMNPHFLFNALNAIQHFIFNMDKQNAMAYMSKFARLMRLILAYSKETEINLQDEIDFLRLYLDIEVMRFEEKLRYVIEVENTIDTHETYIPAMVIQPMVENAIKHGLLNRNEGGTINIFFSTVGPNCLKCIVKDNGIGREKAKEIGRKNVEMQTGTGIKSTIERLALLQTECPKEEIFRFVDLFDEEGIPSGSAVELLLPKCK